MVKEARFTWLSLDGANWTELPRAARKIFLAKKSKSILKSRMSGRCMEH